MAGVLSKGIKLSYKASSSSSSYTDLTDLQEIPELGGVAESIEITTLDDDAHMYMNGIKNFGDSLNFTFLYKPAQFATLDGMNDGTSYQWKVSIPDGEGGAIDTVCTFSGTCSVSLAGAGVNAALTYTLAIKPDSSMVFA